LQNNLIDEQVFEQAKDEIVQTLSGFSSTRCFILAILCAKVGTFSLWTLTSVAVVYEVSDW
jgi:hypothetical protein